MPKDASHLEAELITSALMILSESFKLETRRKVNENESRYNPKTLKTSSAGGQPYISFKGSLCGKEEALQWQNYYLSLFKVKASRAIEIRIGKEGISTWAGIFIISETIIDDQCHYEWWDPTLVIHTSKRWEWLSFPLQIASFSETCTCRWVGHRLLGNRWPGECSTIVFEVSQFMLKKAIN